PAVSTWGVVTLGLIVLAAGTVVLRRRSIRAEVLRG
ncbi:MAG: IPTL-CTERM sorting domain-containing protein, partial [Vicinamibacteria bacterium]